MNVLPISTASIPITLTPYEQWRTERIIQYEDWAATLHEMDDRLWRECDDCDGEGATECNQGHEHTCDTCDGLGKIRKEAPVTQEDYLNHIAADFLALCAWTRQDFLGVIGPIVRQVRGYQKTEQGETHAKRQTT